MPIMKKRLAAIVCVCVTVSLGTATPQFAVAKAAEAKIDVGPGDAPSPSRILPEPHSAAGGCVSTGAVDDRATADPTV